MPSRRSISAADGTFVSADFCWDVHDAGYVVATAPYIGPDGDCRRKDGVVVMPAILTRPGRGVQQRNPLRTPALYRWLAETKLTPDGVREFANQHGLLGIARVTLVDAAAEGPTFVARGDGELFANWTAAITDIRAATRLLDALRRRSDDKLCGVFMLESEMDPATAIAAGDSKSYGRFMDRGAPDWVLIGRDDSERPVRFHWFVSMAQKEGQCYRWGQESITFDTSDGTLTYTQVPDSFRRRRTAARKALVFLVNHHLHWHCFPVLQPRPRRPDSYAIRMFPKSLIGAVWLQFARLLLGHTTYLQCKVCGQTIELSAEGEGYRADAVFCSDRCRQKGHRARVRRAKQLRLAGRTMGQIAKELDTTTAAIKKWLKKKK